jgi:uncharacterized protein
MLGELSEREIEELLIGQLVARIGCHSDGISYVVPLNYVYDGGYIYSHAFDGMKVHMMRKNPEVSFQTDIIKDLNDWQSVVAWGTFEEITDMEEKQQVMQKLINHLMPLMKSDAADPSHGFTASSSDIGPENELIVYKIILKKKTGMFERV